MNEKISIILRRPLVIGAATVAVVLCLLWGLGHALIDKKIIARRLFDGVYQITGYNAHAASIDISIFPLPEIIFERFEIDNHPQASTGSFLLAENLTVSLSVTDLLMGRIRPSAISIERPVVELEAFADRTTNWDFVKTLKNADLNFITPSEVAVVGGSINVTDAVNHTARSFDAIAFELDFDDLSHDADVSLSFDAFEKNVTIEGMFTAKAFSSISQYSFGLNLDVREGNNHASYRGEIGHDHFGLNYDGIFALELENVIPWMEVFFSREAKEGVFHNFVEAAPLYISGKAKATGEKYALTEISVKSAGSDGSGQVVSDANMYPQVQAAFDFTALDFSKIFDPKRPLSDETFNRFLGRFMPPDVSAAVNVRADNFTIAGIAAKDAKVMLTLDGGEMVINQAAFHMAGETELLILGIIKRSLDEAIHFDGNIELIGARLKDFTAELGFDKKHFVTDHEGEFRAKASMFLSKANSIVSGFKFQAGNLLASGGMTARAEDEEDAEITLRISGIKLDPFAAVLIPTSAKDLKKSDFEDIIRRLKWLDKMRSTFLVNLVLQNYTLSKTAGEQSTMHIKIQPGKLAFTDTQFELGGIMFSGGFSYDQREEFPLIESEMNISQFNIEPFTANNLRKSPVPRDNYQSVWSEEYFSFSYLKGFKSKLDVSFGKVFHPEFPMTNVHLSAQSDNGKWEIKGFQADLWEGLFKANGSLDVTSMPAFSLGFSFEDIASEKLVNVMAGRSNFKGKVSLNGQFNTSGINTHNWVKNGQGTFAVLGQNTIVKGFDVSALVQAVPSVRTVADVVNAARVSMLQRHTTFAVVEGGFYMASGVLKPTELKLRAKHSIGRVTGQMDFTTWMMDCGIEFGLVSLARGDYPTLGIHFANSMDDPEITLDTRSIESFIARKKLR